jgi:hypothetical protein
MRKFSLQFDGFTDISDHAHFIANIRYIDGDIITSDISVCKELPQRTTCVQICRITSDYLPDKRLQWKGCVSVCTDGAVIADRWQFRSEVREEDCLVYREATISKTLSVLKNVLDQAIKTGKFGKSRPLNSLILPVLCQELGSEHTSLLLHTQIRWLSPGKAHKPT